MTPNNNIIQGQLPFQAPGNPLAGAQGGLSGLADQYANSYNSALGQNQALYNNILQGYQQTAANQTNAQQAIGSGYNQLYNNVLGGIQGIGQSQSQAIADVYAQQSGGLAQQLTNSGLGNTTVAAQMQRGPQLDAQKAQVALANQMAQLTAGYQSNLGMAGLNQQNTANMQNTALAGQQLGWMNSVQAQYPNAQDYYGLYQQQGQWQQAQADRDLALKLSQQGRASVAAPPGVGGVGFGSHSAGADMQQPIGMRGVSPQGGTSPVLSSGGADWSLPSWALNNPTPQAYQQFGQQGIPGIPMGGYGAQGSMPEFAGPQLQSSPYDSSYGAFEDPYGGWANAGDLAPLGDDPYAWY